MSIYECFGKGYFKKVSSLFALAFGTAAAIYFLNSKPAYAEEKRAPAGEIEIEVPSYDESLEKITVDMSEYKKEVGKVKEDIGSVKKQVGETNKKLDDLTKLLKGIGKNKEIVVKNGQKLNLDDRLKELEENIKKHLDEYLSDKLKGMPNAIATEINKDYVSKNELYSFLRGYGTGAISALLACLLGYFIGRRSRAKGPGPGIPTQTIGINSSVRPASEQAEQASEKPEKGDDDGAYG